MSILVIGGTGFIGPRVIRRLAARGDVTQFEDVMRAALETKPDRLLNLSYLLGGGEGNPHHTMRLNILGMDNCFEVARLCGIQRVVYASSVAVSGPQRHFGERQVNEDDPKFGTSQYAMHKIFNEFQAAQYIKNYGMSITGVRPANVTGPDKVRGSTDHVQLITLPAQGKPVHLPGKSFMRLPIYVEDIAEVFVRVLLADAPRYPIYNSGGTPISLGELADLVREFLPDAQISFENEGGLEESGTYLVDNTRLRQEFDVEYPPFRTWVLEIINDVRRQEGLPPIAAR